MIRNVPSELGEPVFDKIEAILGHAMLSIPASKAFCRMGNIWQNRLDYRVKVW